MRAAWLRAVVFAFFLSVLVLLSLHYNSVKRAIIHYGGTVVFRQGELDCKGLPGANDTVVVFKTGSTEFQDKLPVHLKTTLRCYPNYMIVSDHEETFRGHKIIDVLDSVSPHVRDTNPDFEIYRRLQEQGRKALNQTELSGSSSHETPEAVRLEIPGWKLDKWKFLPMMNRTLYEWPDKQWYIFVEADTFVFWKTLLAYLANLDATQPYYLGNTIQVDGVYMNHGGSGVVVSRPALENVVEVYSKDQSRWEDLTNAHRIGDFILGKAFKESGTRATSAWPIFQGDEIGLMDYSKSIGGQHLWCYPSVSYHHMNAEAIENMWRFEQDWLAEDGRQNDTSILRHRDIFHLYMLPRIQNGSRVDWDNRSYRSHGYPGDLRACQTLCEQDLTCSQYSFNSTGECCTSGRATFGTRSPGFPFSGWMPDRIAAKYPEERFSCNGETWLS